MEGHKALFIPIRACWFREFASGEKTIEFRKAGKRWNAQTCFVGRQAVISCGYSGSRLRAVVVDFKILPFHQAPIEFIEIFGEVDCAAITLRILPD